MAANQIVLFQSTDGAVSLPVQLGSGNVWLTQAQMAQLFGTEFSDRINRIYRIGTAGFRPPERKRRTRAVSRSGNRPADEEKLDAWLSKHECAVSEALLAHRYIIDIDSTVKPIYGHQEGTELARRFSA